MRICIDLELHLPPRQPLPSLDEQHRRRVFYECYILDRHSSSTLGRPFAISDTDIEVELPASGHNGEMVAVSTGDSALSRAPTGTAPPDNLSIFVFIIRLRALTSRIHNAFFVSSTGISMRPSYAAFGDMTSKLYELLEDLRQWRLSGPIFAQPSSLYQKQEYYDFLYEKERLWLIRGAMDAYTANTLSTVPKALTDLCTSSATQVILLYQQMLVARVINCTRGYFQMLFTAGCALVYCRTLRHRKAEYNSPGDRNDASTLEACAEVLDKLADTLVDARPYASVFNHIKNNFVAEERRYRSDRSKEPAEMAHPGQGNNWYDAELSRTPGTAVATAGGSWESHGLDPTLPGMQDLQHTSDSDWMLSAWSPSAYQLFADVEADVNQYAVGDWSFPNAFGGESDAWF